MIIVVYNDNAYIISTKFAVYLFESGYLYRNYPSELLLFSQEKFFLEVDPCNHL